MKTSAVIIFLCAFTIAFAQPGPRPRSVDDQLKSLKKDLTLTDEQVGKIKPILEEQQKEMDALRDKAQGDRTAMFEKFREIREKSDKKIMEVLNEGQKEKYAKIVEDRANRRRDWQGRPGRGDRSSQ
jgi:Spy/CpxP family protein refolding chaperone